MKKLVATAPRVAALVEYEDRAILANEVKIRVRFGAPKHGTEVVDFRAASPFIDEDFNGEWQMFTPRPADAPRGIEFGKFQLGNMVVGDIIECGSDVTDYAVGDSVCGYGPLSETVIINAVNNYKLRKMPQGSSWKNAVCYDPAQFAMSGVRDANVRVGDFVVVVGLGAIGQIAIQLAKRAGASVVIGVDPIAHRCDIARRHGADFFLAEGQYLTDAGKTESVVCSFSRKGGKVLKRNGKEYERLSDHVGLIPAVIVSPADSALISDAADERRRYLNGFISQLDRTYLAAVMRYNGVLAERNRLLKNMPDETMLRIYDLQLVEQGNRIHALRREFTQRLQPVVADYYRTLSGDREQVELHYKSELNDRPFDELLLAARQKDLANEFTTAGIHRDDLVLKIGGYPLRKYGSQGQQKSFLIALKLAQYTIVAREKGEKPILLLDDLFDKLDAGRVEQLIRLVSEDSFGQILITDCNPTRLRTILDKAGGEYALFTVGNGAVTQGNATATAAAADPDKGSAGSRPGNAVTDGAAEPMEEKTPGQTGTAAADRTEGQAGESPAGEPARRPSEPVPAPEPAEEPAAEPDGNGARPGDAASEGGRP